MLNFIPRLSLLLLLSSALLFSCSDNAGDAGAANSETGIPESLTAASSNKPELPVPYVVVDSTDMMEIQGMQIYMIRRGKGPKPLPSHNVIINYHGMLLDGSVFDSSFQRGTVADFKLSNLIQGWQIALTQVPTGSEVRLIIPPELAYGPDDRTGIPGNSILVFDIELLSSY